MNFISKKFLPLISASLIFGCSHTYHVKKFTKRNIKKFIELQEDSLGIKHFGTPNIKFYENQFWVYRPKKDEISVPTYAKVILPEKCKNPFEKKSSEEYILEYELERFLYHEFGHFYTDKLNESLGFGDFDLEEYSKPERKRIRLIGEGIAEYFERKTGSKNSEEFIGDFENISETYEKGFHLVGPIIDGYGQKGIEYLIQNIPQEKDMLNLKKYQKKSLESLEKLEEF